jgi:hypothetical protein
VIKLMEQVEMQAKQWVTTPGYAGSICGPDVTWKVRPPARGECSQELKAGPGRAVSIMKVQHQHPTVEWILEQESRAEGAWIKKTKLYWVMQNWKSTQTAPPTWEEASHVLRMLQQRTHAGLETVWRECRVLVVKDGEESESLDFDMCRRYFEDMTVLQMHGDNIVCACAVFCQHGECARPLGVKAQVRPRGAGWLQTALRVRTRRWSGRSASTRCAAPSCRPGRACAPHIERALLTRLSGSSARTNRLPATGATRTSASVKRCSLAQEWTLALQQARRLQMALPYPGGKCRRV